MRRSFEHLYHAPSTFPQEAWRLRFFGHKQIRALTERLIWRISDQNSGLERSALPHLVKDKLSWRLAGGELIAATSADMVQLWHPLTASTEEREAWRDVVIAERLDQPFAQAFRQYYIPRPEELDTSTTSLFAQHRVSIKAFMGVARSEGWQLGDYGDVSLWRAIGPWRFAFDCGGRLFPGLTGDRLTGALQVARRVAGGAGYAATALRPVDAVMLSEVLRSVDLLTSVGAFAYDPVAMVKGFLVSEPGGGATLHWHIPGGQSAALRREVLRRLYGRCADGVKVEERHVSVRDYQIHIATGRVTRNSDPVEVDLTDGSRAVVWMPYDDDIMGRIIRTVTHLDSQ